ncbi:DUF2283 domain-containing protein [Cryobacterium sp. PH31-O1]|uniref:DUF2283 domain-containing protein n=1 Tax=Cryobacterium sp. PH31-O1 TaxID=3046306 RepID=UPI0024BAF2DC|nr:DUF2283 domain-containing protein [Cryobacterium sp. PH31-O1]MDJ0336745.1 DUF2283 domain-containing protein [Cryobacterium sp. PH31-O1]
MKLKFDEEANAASLFPGRPAGQGEIATTVSGIQDPLKKGELLLHFDANGRLIEIEILNARDLLRASDLDSADRDLPLAGNQLLPSDSPD